MREVKLSVLVPVLNEAKRLPGLLRALKQQKADLELVFVDNGSTDGSYELLEAAKKQFPLFQLHREKEQGFAQPLRLAVKKASAPLLACLDADCVPSPGWAKAMIAALDEHALVVGETLSLIRKKPTAAEALAKKIFINYSQDAALAKRHALPWGPACNLGLRRELYQQVGPFSSGANAAFDIDWCWRAALQGCLPVFAKAAKVGHWRKETEAEFLKQMHRYGTGEAWIQRRYAFLQDEEDQQRLLQANYPRNAAFQASERVLGLEKRPSDLLIRAALAHGIGVFEGFQQPLSVEEKPARPQYGFAIRRTKKSVDVLVPGKGLLALEGNGKTMWEEWERTRDEKKLALELSRKFSLDLEEAAHEAAHFVAAICTGCEEGHHHEH